MFKKHKGKKGFVETLWLIPSIALAIGVGFLIAAFSGKVVQDTRDTMTSGSAGYNISTNGLVGLQKFTEQGSTIGTVAGAAIIIAILLGAFMVYKMKN